MQYAILLGAFGSAVLLGPILMVLNRTATVYERVERVVPGGLTTDVSKLPKEKEKLQGPEARLDSNSYYVWQQVDPASGTARRFLVDDNGKAVWLVDPGINGTITKRDDGTTVRKFDAPKATLVSYIIKGILDHKLPWALVLLGVMIALTLELCGVPSLVFAVGVYLPISSSMPLFVGGAIRWIADRYWRRHPQRAHLNEEELVAESDKSPGVLLSSGYIAGGAIAGIIIAIVQGVTLDFDAAIGKWADASNPFYAGDYSDLLSLIPFAVLVGLLYLVAKEKILTSRAE